MSQAVRRGNAAVAAVLMLLLWPALAVSQPSPPRREREDQAFCYVLERLGLTPVGTMRELASDPAHTILIVLGQTAPLADVPGGLRHFVEFGGGVLVATDRPSDDALQDELGVHVSGKLVRAQPPSDDSAPKTQYRGMPECPIVFPLPGGAMFFQGIELADSTNLRLVASNNPSYLYSSRLPVVATFPPLSWVEWSLPIGPQRTRPSGLLNFAAAGDWGAGRVLVLSDHSVFVNEMMLPADNGNVFFAHRALRWLSDGHRRERVLLVVDGSVVSNFHVDLRDISKPPPTVFDVMNRVLAGMEDDNFFNKALLAGKRLRDVWGYALIWLTSALVAYGLYRLSRQRYDIDPEAPPAVSSTALAIPAVGVLELRHRVMLEQGNLWEASRDAARDLFAPLGLAPLGAAGEPPGEGPSPPPISVTGGWRQRRSLRERVERLWALAYGGSPRRVSAHEFASLAHQVTEIRQALAEGRLHIDPPEDKA